MDFLFLPFIYFFAWQPWTSLVAIAVVLLIFFKPKKLIGKSPIVSSAPVAHGANRGPVSSVAIILGILVLAYLLAMLVSAMLAGLLRDITGDKIFFFLLPATFIGFVLIFVKVAFPSRKK